MASREASRISMTEGSLVRVLIRVATPIALSNMLSASYQLVNALWVGRLGAEAVAAISASAPLFWVLIALGGGLATAGSVLIAQYMGAKQDERIDRIAAQTLLMVLAVSALFGVVGSASARPVLRMIGVEPGLEDLAASYLTISFAGMAPWFCVMAIQAMLQAVGEVRFAFYVMLCGVVISAGLDPLLIFGIGSWNGWGVAGAAVATVTAQFVALLVALTHLLLGKSALRLRLADFRPDFAHVRRALGIGLPASIEQATRTFGSVVLMAVAAQFGTIALATYGLGVRLMSFFFTPMIGLSVATAVVVGQNIGAGRMDRAEEAGKVGIWLSLAGFTFIGLLLIPTAPDIMALFTPAEPELIEKASLFVLIFAPFLGVFAVPQVLCGVFRGAGSTRQSMGISLAMQWLFQLPAGWILAFFTPLGVLGVWWSYPVGNALAAALAVGWFLWGPWRRSLVR